jgi:cell cycle checkpoint protein
MGFDILEWRNPVGTEFSSEGAVSMSAQFEEFLGRGGKFGSLDLSNGMEKPRDEAAEAANIPNRKKIILVEEFPNTFTRSSAALQSFRSALQYFLASSCPTLGTLFSGRVSANEQIIPLVLIISETLLTTTTASADSFTAHRLIGQEILNHPGVSLINFNPIAPTLLAKAMDLVIQKEARITGRRKTLGRLAQERLGEVGDIRSAVGSLEFLCLRRDDNGDWGGKITFGKGKRISKDTPLTDMERESLELVTQREASLGIFHAVGKVVYNKRTDDNLPDPSSCSISQPPDYLPQHVRLKKPQVSVDELIDETGTDTQTFISALHENYVLSCGNLSSEASLLDSVNGCMDSLSDSDLLCPNWNGGFGSGGMGGGFGRGAFQGAGADSLRQDEMSFQIAVRGILFSLPYPVKRKSPSSPSNVTNWNRVGGKGDAHKMFYPTALKLWRQTEEIKGAVDAWISRLMRGEVTISRGAFPQAGSEAKLRSVVSWRSNFKEHSGTHPTGRSSSDSSATTPPLSGGSAAHREMILERLPYMAKIEWRNIVTLREIEGITLFRGNVVQSDEIPDDDEDTPVVQWATDRPNESGSTPRKKKPRSREFEIDDAVRGGLGFQLPVGKVEALTLSDDDIEDD